MSGCGHSEPPVRTYLLGNGVRVMAKLRDAAGVVVDPTVLRLLVVGPGETESTEYSMTPDAEDEHAIGFFTPTVAGTWRYRVEATSLVDAAAEHSLIVEDRAVPPPPP